jgi:AcrR family transcriptional regulator
LEAVVHTLHTSGSHALTLDVVAKTAGVSKGGLLHHFPSKEALIEALLNEVITRYDALAISLYAQEPPTHGRWLRAYVKATFADDQPAVGVILMLASMLAEHPPLLQIIHANTRLWDARLAEDGVSPIRARVIRAAADGYWFDAITEGYPRDEATRRALMDELLHLIDL